MKEYRKKKNNEQKRLHFMKKKMNKKQQHRIVGGVLKMNSERIRPKGVNKGKRYRKRTPKTSEKKREENRPS